MTCTERIYYTVIRTYWDIIELHVESEIGPGGVDQQINDLDATEALKYGWPMVHVYLVSLCFL